MKNVTYISAGAGSGKTYNLTERLTKLIENKQVRPDEIILTTFTKKAAAEFRARAKEMLYGKGLYDQAAMLDHALIGTIHSVAKTLIDKYWFHLGLSPDMGVMEEADQKFYISQSLADLPTVQEVKALHGFAHEFDIDWYRDYKTGAKVDNSDLWRDHLKQIIELSTNYEITDYGKSRDASIAFVRQFLDENVSLCYSQEQRIAVIDEISATMNQMAEPQDDKKKKLNDLRREVSSPTIAWYKDLGKFLNDFTIEDLGPKAQKMCSSLAQLWRSHEVYDKQVEYIDLLFSLAAKWNKQYTEYKRKRHVVDFDDMEKYMLQLVDDSRIAEEISTGYKYLFVDEFQDCSPIQVKIFDRLSHLMQHSYWVGDYKQSVYGFRGSDIKLVKAVVDQAKLTEGCDVERLDISYRSLPEIVELCNHTFAQTFPRGIDVELKPNRQTEDGTKPLRYWDVAGRKKEVRAEKIARHVARLLKSGVTPSDVAVLAFENSDLNTLSKVLALNGIPVSRGESKVAGQQATILLQALLAIVVNDRDTLAKAQVAFLTAQGYNLKHIIEERLSKGEEFLDKIPLVKEVSDMAGRLKQLPVAALVETLVVECALYDVVKQWPGTETSLACLDAAITAAAQYEQRCVMMSAPATVTGFISYLNDSNPAISGNPDGVQLTTYHSSKGLEWKYVIMTSLNDDVTNAGRMVKKEVYGVRVKHSQEPTAKNPFPDVAIRVSPFIYSNAENAYVPKDIQAIIEKGDLYQQIRIDVISEKNRLLYVGMTRARDVLVLTLEAANNQLRWVKDVGGTVSVPRNIGQMEKAPLLGEGHVFYNDTLADAHEMDEYKYASTTDYLTKKANYPQTASKNDPRDLAPSMAKGSADIKASRNFGKRIPLSLRGDSTMTDVGNCIHQIYCALDANRDNADYVPNIVAAYGLSDALPTGEEIAQAWDRLVDYLRETHGEAQAVYHEREFTMYEDGQIYRGSIDLVWQTAQGDILIDYKTCPMGKDVFDPASDHYAGSYAGQVNCYTKALQKAGEKVLCRYIYYPVSGLIVEI